MRFYSVIAAASAIGLNQQQASLIEEGSEQAGLGLKKNAKGESILDLGSLQDMIKHRQANHECFKDHGVKFNYTKEEQAEMARQSIARGGVGVTAEEEAKYKDPKYAHGFKITGLTAASAAAQEKYKKEHPEQYTPEHLAGTDTAGSNAGSTESATSGGGDADASSGTTPATEPATGDASGSSESTDAGSGEPATASGTDSGTTTDEPATGSGDAGSAEPATSGSSEEPAAKEPETNVKTGEVRTAGNWKTTYSYDPDAKTLEVTQERTGRRGIWYGSAYMSFKSSKGLGATIEKVAPGDKRQKVKSRGKVYSGDYQGFYKWRLICKYSKCVWKMNDVTAFGSITRR